MSSLFMPFPMIKKDSEGKDKDKLKSSSGKKWTTKQKIWLATHYAKKKREK